MTDLIPEHPALQSILADCDHYDHKTIDATVDLRTFLAGMMNFYPGWMKTLYRIRWGFVRLLGMRQEGIPSTPDLKPEDVNFEAGTDALFFTVQTAEEDAYWVAGATESHLTAYLIVVVDPLNTGDNRFHVGTAVHYHNWAGPVYFNIIRPFHHLVVKAMMHAGARNVPSKAVGYA